MQGGIQQDEAVVGGRGVLGDSAEAWLMECDPVTMFVLRRQCYVCHTQQYTYPLSLLSKAPQRFLGTRKACTAMV